MSVWEFPKHPSSQISLKSIKRASLMFLNQIYVTFIHPIFLVCQHIWGVGWRIVEEDEKNDAAGL